MLNREEYNSTFHVDLSAEEFERLKPIVLGGDNIKDVESITAVIPNTLERVEFVPVVRCGKCANRKYCEHPQKVDSDWFCADGERRSE